jgi:Tol biopolymer transport system component
VSDPLMPASTPLPRPRRARLLLLAGALVAVGAGIGAYLAFGGSSNTTAEEDAAIPAADDPLPVDSMLVTRLQAPGRQIYSLDATSKAYRILFSSPAHASHLAALSPDRRSVVYARWFPEAARSELWVASVAGSPERLLASDPVNDGRASWSPDGQRVTYAARRPNGVTDLVILDVATGAQSWLTDDAEDEGDPAWSPDGSEIAFWKKSADGQNLYIIDSEAGVATQLTTDQMADSDPAWSSDGSRIAFARALAGNITALFVMQADGTGVFQLLDSQASDSDPSWSPDDQRIAFESTRSGKIGIHSVGTNGAGVQILSSIEQSFDGEVHPAWGRAPIAEDG